MKICGYFWGVITKLDDFFLIFFFGGGGGGSFLYILGLFKVKMQNRNIFWAAKFQIFWEGLIFLFFFFVVFFFWGGGGGGGGLNSRCWVQAYV